MTISPPVATVTDQDGTCVITLTGDIDMDTAWGLVAAGVEGVNATTSHVVVLDLSYVTFLDSTGVGALVEIRNAAAARALPMHVRAGSSRVMKPMLATGLEGDFDIA